MNSDDNNIQSGITIAADSHVGLVRKANEDSFGYNVDPKRDFAMFAVADGIGGHGNGDVASAICIRLMLEQWRKLNLDEPFGREQATRFFSNILNAANDKIFQINNRFSFRYPMGTTVVAGIATPEDVIVVHLGDSRLYRMNGELLKKVTEDHSFVAEMVRNKLISQDEARNHPFSHIISRSIGPNRNIEPEFSYFKRVCGDRILLCSDGLSNYALDDEISARMIEEGTPRKIVNNLLKLSLKRGGEDNITIISVQV